MTVAQVLVVGAAGVTGQHIIKAVKASKDTKWEVRAGILAHEHKEEQERALGKFEIATVPIDCTHNVDACAEAMKDVEELVVIPPPGLMEKAGQVKCLLEAAKKAKVKFVLLVSMYGVDEPDFIFGQTYRQFEECMGAADFPAHCIVRPQYYVQNLLLLRDRVRKGDLPFPIGSGKFAPIDADDVGEAVCAILKNPSAHAGKVYNLTGPKAMTAEDIAQVFSKVTGKTIKATDDATTAKAHLKQSISPSELLGILELYQVVASGKLCEVSKDAESLLGHPGTSLEQWAKEHEEMFKQ